MDRLRHFTSPVILIWITVVIILIPILRPGFFSFHDETHMVDVYEMIRSLQLGGFPPRFAPDFNFGLGYPYFNFYYHLPFYITTVFHYLSFSMTDSFKYMLGLAVILSASGFYFLLRNHVSKVSAVFGTLVYILSPYFAVDLYVRGAPGEMYIFALFPWAGYFLNKYLKKSDSVNLAMAAISIFLIGISHNVLLPFIYLLLFLYSLVNLIIFKTDLKKSLKIFLPFILGVLLASYYLLPAFAEVKFVSAYEQINIADHFPFIKQLILPHWGYGPSIWGFLDDISFDIGTVNLIFLLVSFVIFKFAKREVKILLIFFWIVFAMAVILMNSRTLFFWESIRFLRLVQFPWRMLLLTTISTSFITGLVTEVISQKFKKSAPAFLAATFILLMAFNIWHYHPSEYKQISDEIYLERYFAYQSLDGERLKLNPEYLNFTEDFIPLTIWQSKRFGNFAPRVRLEYTKDYSDVIVHQDNLFYDINYKSDIDQNLIVQRTYFPGWEATLNGQKIPIEPYSEYGIIAIPVASGSGSIHLAFNDTPIRTIADSISAIAAAVILVSLIYPKLRKKND